MSADCRRGDAGRLHDADKGPDAVALGVVTRHAHGRRIDVGCQDAPAQRARGGDGKNAGAGAEIENPRRSLSAAERLTHPVEGQQTTARRAMMAGAEGERGFDLDADAVDRDPGSVVRAVDDEAAGRDRL